MEKVLNQEEIDAMVRAARSGDADRPVATGPVVNPGTAPGGSDRTRTVARDQPAARSLCPQPDARHRRIPARSSSTASLVSAEHLTYREFLQRIPEKTYLASCDLAPAGVIALLQLDLAIAFPIIDVLLGGEGKGGEAVRDITEIEEQVIESIIRIICRELQTTWEAISLEFNFGQRQQIAQAQRLMVPDEKNLCLSFEIKMSETRGTLNLAVPAVISNALFRKISADLSYQRPHGPIEARHQIENKLLDCQFSVELSLPHLHVPLQSLVELTPGAVLPFSRNASAPAVLQVEEVRLCMAAPVRVNYRRAARGPFP